jgi:hypothetical protein
VSNPRPISGGQRTTRHPHGRPIARFIPLFFPGEGVRRVLQNVTRLVTGCNTCPEHLCGIGVKKIDTTEGERKGGRP